MKHEAKRIVANSSDLFVLIHGMESSHVEWLERDGYTKGGNFTAVLEANGFSWVTCDLYGHGSWSVEGFDPADYSDEDWFAFVRQSVARLRKLVNQVAGENPSFRRLHLATYSVGCAVGVRLAREELSLPLDSFFMASPVPLREYDDETSLHNNQEAMASLKVFGFVGVQDEESPTGEVDWFFEQLSCTRKRLYRYESGHSLPVAWVGDAFSDWQPGR